MAFSGALTLVALGLVMFTCGGTVYPKSSPEDCYRVMRWVLEPPAIYFVRKRRVL
jgi:hypothetical protein